MIIPPQSSHDSIHRILNDHDGMMKIGDLKKVTGLRLYELTPILEDLEREGKIGIEGKLYTFYKT